MWKETKGKQNRNHARVNRPAAQYEQADQDFHQDPWHRDEALDDVFRKTTVRTCATMTGAKAWSFHSETHLNRQEAPRPPPQRARTHPHQIWVPLEQARAAHHYTPCLPHNQEVKPPLLEPTVKAIRVGVGCHPGPRLGRWRDILRRTHHRHGNMRSPP